MSQERFARIFTSRHSNGYQAGQESLRGFTTNPLGATVTPNQALIYQAAYQRALEEIKDSEWPLAEMWN
jgi:hypothetical protein